MQPPVTTSRRARLGLGLIVALPILGIQAPAIHAASPITLTLQDWAPSQAIATMYQPCEAKLNMKIKFSFVPRTGYETKLQTQFASGSAPDIYDAPPEDVDYYGAKGQALDQVPYLKQLGLPYNKVVPQAQFWAGGKVGTKLWAQAQGAQSMYIFYNKGDFTKAGVSTPPTDAAHAWTWSQFVAVAKKLTLDRNGHHPDDPGFDAHHIRQYGLNVGLWYATLLPLIWSNGGRDFDASGKHFLLNQPAAAQVIQDFADLALKDHVMPTPSALTSGAGSLTVASGRVAMEFNGNWQLYTYTYPKPTFSFGIGVLPRFNQYHAFYFAGSGFVVSARTKYPRQAVQFDDCMTYEGLNNYQTGLWVPTTTNLLYGSGTRTWLNNAIHPATYKSVVIDTIKTAYTPPFNYVTQFGPIWTNTLGPVLNQIEAGTPAQQALNAVKPQIDALLANS
jgi:multiple sugar transport system substrate-binding protein